MPTISRSRVHPLVTPSTALLTRARASPCTAACESFSRTATRFPSLCSTTMPAGRAVSNLPLGPCTSTVLPSILTVTPLGIGIGFFPIRDIRSALKLLAPGFQLVQLDFGFGEQPEARSDSLPDLAQQFAAHAFFTGLASRHHSPWRSKDVDPHTAEHARNLAAPHIDAASRARYALRLRNSGLIVGAIFQINSDDLVTFFLSSLEIRDVALFLQNAGNLQFQPGGWDVHLLVPRLERIAHPRQHICNRIGQPHRLLLL